MATHCQTAMWNRRGKHHNLVTVCDFLGRKRVAVNFKLRTYLIGAVYYKLCMSSECFVKYIILISESFVQDFGSLLSIILTMFYFDDRWSVSEPQK